MKQSQEIMNAILKVAEKSLLEVERSSGEKTAQVLQRNFTTLKRLARKLDAAQEEEYVPEPAIVTLDSQMENLREICERRFHRDIRSWEDRAIQKEDAKIALFTMKSYWERFLNPDTASKALPGAPNYRFRVGEKVKVVSSGFIGKVVTCEKENGTGKQVFWVKLKDETKKYFVRDLKRYEQ
jgi:hypothetical protein